MIVYCARNRINDKVYVGQTTKFLEIRKSEHLADAAAGRGFLLHRALRKYGVDAFEWQEIDHALDEADLNVKEVWWIAYYDSTNPSCGYNIVDGGEGGMGRANRGKCRRPFSAEHRKKIGDSKRGKRRPREYVERMRLGLIGRVHSEEYRRKMSQACQGKVNSSETRGRMSKAKQKWWSDPANKSRMSSILKGRSWVCKKRRIGD